MSFVSSLELQQYPVKGAVFFAVGIDFGRLSTFSQSVFNMIKAVLLLARMGKTDKWLEAEMGAGVGVNSTDEGPEMGWEHNTKSAEINKCKSIAIWCHTVIDIKI